MDTKRRILIASNRLPVSVEFSSEDDFSFKPASGGLASGLSGVTKSLNFQWYGWPGCEIPDSAVAAVSSKLQKNHSSIPVLLEKGEAEKYYNGFSNSIIWPLFHYQPERASFDDSTTEAYRNVNRIFAERISEDVQDGDIVWVHDYHLMLVPAILRAEIDKKKKLDVKIGFFLHTPFPNGDFFGILPSRHDILRSLLHCDLVGFHVEEYTKHFQETCSDVLSLETKHSSIMYNKRRIRIGTFPLGINPEEFQERLLKDGVRKLKQQFQESFKDKYILVGVDRLDFIKGVPQKLDALDKFFEQKPEFVGKVVMIQVVVPSRMELEQNQKLRKEVSEMVGRINGKYGTMDYVPVHFMFKSIGSEELTALYAASDACVVSSTRDGMNLVCYEYIACQEERRGIVVLSQFAGAAKTLPGCIVANPWNTDEFANAIIKALTMPDEERHNHHEQASEYVHSHTSFYWARSFIASLEGKDDQQSF